MRALARLVLILLAALVVSGVVYEQLGEWRDRRRYPRIGHAVDIGGRKLNLYCSGEGAPSVIVEGAGHTAGYAWIDIQREVAKFTRACWYDRAGYGWSDPGPSPRTFLEIARDLHALLQAEAIPAPYVLVGATAGAFHVRVYNGLYPGDVAGAVLIRATDTDVFSHEPEYMKGRLDSLPPLVQKIGCAVVAPLALRVGLLRLMGNPGAGVPFGIGNLAPSEQKELLFLSTNPRTAQTEGEGCTLDESMAEVRAAGDFGNRPLYVLADSTPFAAPDPAFARETGALNDYWFHELQPRLAALSTRGHLVLQEKAEDPPSIIRAIRAAVEEARSTPPR